MLPLPVHLGPRLRGDERFDEPDILGDLVVQVFVPPERPHFVFRKVRHPLGEGGVLGLFAVFAGLIGKMTVGLKAGHDGRSELELNAINVESLAGFRAS